MKIIIVGAGGHAQVVTDILLSMQKYNSSIQPIGFVDDDLNLIGKKILGLPVSNTIAHLSEISHDAVVISIGNNRARKRLFESLHKNGERVITACHPQAIIGADVVIGEGCMICAGVVINTGSVVGENVILNTSCSIDHHNVIADHCHIAPGVHLGGEVAIGTGSIVGIGATVMPRCHIGEWSTIGAGACVIKSITAGLTVVGVPAKPLKRREP